MKNKLFLTVAAAAMVLGSTGAMAAQQIGTGNATAKIVEPVTITQNGDGLNFGILLSKANTVTVDTNDTRSATDESGLVDGVLAKSGRFTIKGLENHTLNIVSVVSDGVKSGANTMSVGNFVTLPAKDIVLDGAGDGTLTVGADLKVSEGQAAGDYTGTYVVTVSY